MSCRKTDGKAIDPSQARQQAPTDIGSSLEEVSFVDQPGDHGPHVVRLPLVGRDDVADPLVPLDSLIDSSDLGG